MARWKWARWKWAGVAVLGLCSCPLAAGLQARGRVRIVQRRPRPNSVPVSSRPQKQHGPRVGGGQHGVEGVKAKGGAASQPPVGSTLETRDMFQVERVGIEKGRKRKKKRISPRGGGPKLNISSQMRRRLRLKVKDAGKVPDLSRMLRDGLAYLTRNEATEVQLALAVSLYAHSKWRHEQPNDRVKAGVEVCLQLGRLRMGKEALLAAILSGVLRPGILSEHPVGFGSAPVTLVDIREGFGPNVARLVAGLEHVTCVEETAHSILRGSTRDLGESAQALSPSSVIGVEGRTGRKGAGRRVGRGDGVKRGGLRDASILEQGEKLRNLILSEAADWQVLTLWLAVHLQTLKESLVKDTGKASEQLARDALIVHGPLAHRLGVHQLRNELETAAFRRLFPDQFHEVRRVTQDRSSVHEKVLETTKDTLSKAFRDSPTFTSQVEGEVVLQHRIKSPYSLWSKMERKQVSVEGVFDAVAIRVLFEAQRWQEDSIESYTSRSEDLCYQAMAVIQRLYPSVEQRLKDYVQNPKPNGYQSLHATQLVPDASTNGPPVTIEFQVRTKEMHQKAEFGLAAHWSYKGSSGSVASTLGWISNDTSTHEGPGKAIVPESVTSGRELVDWLHQELQQRKVFVFGPDKRIWELDKSSATAAHVLGRSHMQSFYEGAVLHSHRENGGARGDRKNRPFATAWVNGQEVDPSYLLKNGDVFDVQRTLGVWPTLAKNSKSTTKI